MTTNAIGNQITLAETMKALGSDDRFLSVIDGLVEVNDMIADAPLKEASTITSDEISRVVTYPVPQWKNIGEGWNATSGRLQSDSEGMGVMKNRLQINLDVVDRMPHPEQYMRLQETMHLNAMAEEAANTIVYGSSGSAPEEFDGLDIRYNALSSAAWSDNGVFNNGEGSGSTCTSIWLIQWHATECALIYPRYDPNAGLTRTPKPNQLINTAADANSPYSNQISAWFALTEFSWALGLSLADNRRVKRVCNIQSTQGDEHSLDEDVLSNAILDFDTDGPIYAYCNKQVIAQLQKRVNNKSNVNYVPDSPFAKPMYYFLDVPLRRMKAITNAESVIA